MEHIKDFTIHRFRGLRDLQLENLGQINLFVGDNNSGKTTVLEAASIFCDPLNRRKWQETGLSREVANSALVDSLTWLFPQKANNNTDLSPKNMEMSLSASGSFPIEKLSASYEIFTEITRFPVELEDGLEEIEEESKVLRVKVSISAKDLQPTSLEENTNRNFRQELTFHDYRPLSSNKLLLGPRLPNQIVTPFSHRTSRLTLKLWSEVVEADLKAETIELLRFFDPAIQDVDSISPTQSRQFISIKHDKLGRAPLYTFGDGLRRIFTLATTIPRVRGGLLLIDELETTIHTKALEKTFNWLVNACIKNDVQLFATTHSLEALDAILEASREHANLVVYRLQQEEKQTTATRFDKEMALRLREELGMEMRY
jgi:AAA15 family ATPase/GTPase